MSGPDETVRQSEEDREQALTLSRDRPSLPGYELREELGAGAFGVVWSGVQARTGQAVAVKVLKAEARHWGYLRHELSKLRQISNHPFVVGLLDADLDNQPPFFVMPLLTRGSLAEKSESDLEQIETWLRQIAQALSFMHSKGLLHCDLKPSNILLDDEQRCRVVDFGQARLEGDFEGAFGTLGFMPPEQAQNSVHPDVSWDVYGFGATAYKLLTGQCPRLNEEDRTKLTHSISPEERLKSYRQILGTRALIPVKELNPEVDDDLATIVESCLAIDPGLRAPSLGQVLEDLDRMGERSPLLCQKPWTVRYRLRRFLARPLVALLLCTTILFPVFVNSYLTVHAQLALRDRAEAEVHSMNQVVSRGMDKSSLERLRTKDFHHHFICDGVVVQSSQADHPERIDLEALTLETGSPDRGFYERDGVEFVGAWSKRGDGTLLTERPRTLVMESARYILSKNWMLNIVILLLAIATVVALLKPRRRP